MLREGALDGFAADVRAQLSLNPRRLSSRYLYDDLGSALFEAICHLPWYPIPRAESRLLAAHAAEVFHHIGEVASVIELGPGSGAKLRLFLEGARARRTPLDVHLVDVSASALSLARHALDALPGVRVVTHEATYEAGLLRARRASRGRTLVAWLGSNIGNFDEHGAAALMRELRSSLGAGDAVLLGADLVKPEAVLLSAYDDPLGVTAAFNLNLLARINRELGGNFEINQWAHTAVWNPVASRIEMHVVSRAAQTVRIPAAGLEFDMAIGETIWTESSYKYQPSDLAARLEGAGFRVAAQWIDRPDQFALTLAVAI